MSVVEPRLVLSMLLHMFGSCAYELSRNSLSDCMPDFQHFLNASFEEQYSVQPSPFALQSLSVVVVVAFEFGAALGAVLMGYAVDTSGRKLTLMVYANILQIGASFVLFLAVHFVRSLELLLLGRWLSGMAAALAEYSLVLMAAECAPDNIRGCAVLGVACGRWAYGLVSALASLIEPSSWRALLILPVFPCAIHLMLHHRIPDSPTFLYVQQRNRMQAIVSLYFYRGDQVDYDREFLNYDHEINQAPQEVRLKDLAQNSSLRQILQLAGGCLCCYALFGQSTITNYTTAILLSHHFSLHTSQLYTLACCGLKILVQVLVCALLVDAIERRRLFAISCACSGLCMLCITLPQVVTTVFVVLLPLSIASSTMNVGLLLAIELCPVTARGSVLQIVLAVYRLVSCVELLSVNYFGHYMQVAFLLPAALLMVRTYRRLPALSQRPTDDILSDITSQLCYRRLLDKDKVKSLSRSVALNEMAPETDSERGTDPRASPANSSAGTTMSTNTDFMFEYLHDQIK